MKYFIFTILLCFFSEQSAHAQPLRAQEESFLTKRVPSQFNDPGTSSRYVAAYEKFVFQRKDWIIRMIVDENPESAEAGKDFGFEISPPTADSGAQIRWFECIPSVTEAVNRNFMSDGNKDALEIDLQKTSTTSASATLDRQVFSAITSLWGKLLPGGGRSQSGKFAVPHSVWVCFLKMNNGSVEIGKVRSEYFGTNLLEGFEAVVRNLRNYTIAAEGSRRQAKNELMSAIEQFELLLSGQRNI